MAGEPTWIFYQSWTEFQFNFCFVVTWIFLKQSFCSNYQNVFGSFVFFEFFVNSVRIFEILIMRSVRLIFSVAVRISKFWKGFQNTKIFYKIPFFAWRGLEFLFRRLGPACLFYWYSHDWYLTVGNKLSSSRYEPLNPLREAVFSLSMEQQSPRRLRLCLMQLGLEDPIGTIKPQIWLRVLKDFAKVFISNLKLRHVRNVAA